MDESLILLLTQLDKKLSQRICSKVSHDDFCKDILQDVYLKIMQRIHLIEKADNMTPYVML
jgi:RNA polymerase sigma-70 factor, ECF subfamily